MISSTLGAPFGGTTRAGQYGFDWSALRSMVPPNVWGGGGNCAPSIVFVASGAPGVPEIVCLDFGPPVLLLSCPLVPTAPRVPTDGCCPEVEQETALSMQLLTNATRLIFAFMAAFP